MFLKAYAGVTTWLNGLKERTQEERGATAVEYALMVALIAVVIIAAVVFLGEELNGLFETIGDELSGAGGEAPAAG